MTITPPSDLIHSTIYQVGILGAVIVDEFGNPISQALPSSDGNYTFTTEAAPPDITPPAITSLAPLDNATGVVRSVTNVIKFDENIALVDPTGVKLRSTDTDAVVAANISVSSSDLFINPTANLESGTSYYVTILDGVITDEVGNAFAGWLDTDKTTYNFTTLDNVGPTLTSSSPADNAVDVPIDANILLTCSEDVVITDIDAVSLRRIVGNAVVPTTKSVVGNVITINPDSDLDPNTGYYVRTSFGAVEDLAGNPGVFINSFATLNFTTAALSDNTPPTISSRNPADNATNVAVNSNVTITFSENVAIDNAGQIQLRLLSNDDQVPSSKTVNGSTLTINPNSNLVDGTDYYLFIGGGGIEDLAGNSFAGISGNTAYNFTTSAPLDNTPPTLLNASLFTPADDAIDVPVDIALVAEFSEPIQLINPSTTNAGTLQNRSNTAETFTYGASDISISGSTLTINLAGFVSGDLRNETPYRVNIFNFTIEDLAGNDFAGLFGNTGWNFTTAAPSDNTPPTVTSFNPADNSSNFDATASFNITFNELIQRGSGDLRIYQTTGNQLVETIDASRPTITGGGLNLFINPVNDLLEDTDYYIEIDAGFAQDLAGNNYEGISDQTTWNFRTAAAVDNTPPTLSSTNPANNATNVPVDSNFEFTFSEPIQSGGGTARLKLFSNSSNQRGFTSASPEVTISGNTLTWNPATDLDPATQYFFTLPNAFVRDLAGNNLAGFSNKITYSFTTAAAIDNTAPQVVSRSPADDATDVSVTTTELRLNFDEPIFFKAGFDGAETDILSRNGGNNYNDIGAANVRIDGTDLILTVPAGGLTQGNGYFVRLTSGSIVDASGNEFGGYFQLDDWNWTMEAIPPSIVSTTPTIGATDAPTNAVFTLAFDVDVAVTSFFNSSAAQLKRRSDDQVLENYRTSDFTANGSTVTLKVDEQLEENYGILYRTRREILI